MITKHNYLPFTLFATLMQTSIKDITTVLNLARKSSDVFTKVVEVMNAFEKGTLDRRVMRQDNDSVSVEPIKFPIYHLRTFGDQMTDTVAVEMLDNVLKKTLPLSKLDNVAKTTQHLQNVEAGLMGEFSRIKSWEELSDRFPHHTSRNVLVSQFGKVMK